MSAFPEPFSFAALDACHQQIQLHLAELATLAQQIENSGISAIAQHQANAIEIFFSGTSRRHHAEEEKHVFPLLLAEADHELAETVRTLQQDHGWIEENWLELAPQLRAMAAGNNWFDAAEFQHNVEVFLTLCHQHIALEEILIYPEAKARSAQIATLRAKRDARVKA
jgi:hemerythrin-like domain-containing protein